MPLLSKKQFLQKRPRGEYENYLKYVANARARRTATQPIGISQLTQRLYGSVLSPKQQREQAKWMVDYALKGQTAALRESSLEEQRAAERQAVAAERLGQAYAPMQTQLDEIVRNAYGGASGLISSQVAGVADALRSGQAAQAAAGQAAVQGLTPGVVAPTGDVGAGAAQLQGNAALAAGVPAASRAYTSGVAPMTPFGGPLVPTGAAAATDIGSQYRYKSLESANALVKAVRELQAKRPDMIREAMQGTSEQNLQTLAALTNVLTLQNTMGKTAADIAIDRAKLTAGTKTDKAKLLAAQGFAPNGKTPLPGFYIPPGAKVPQKIPSGWDWDPTRGKLIPRPAGRPPKADTAGAAAFDEADRVQLESDFRSDAYDYVNNLIGVDEILQRPRRMPPKKSDIVRVVFNLYGRTLLRAGFNEGQIKSWATQVVNGFPNRFWDPKTYKPKKPKTGEEDTIETITGGT